MDCMQFWCGCCSCCCYNDQCSFCLRKTRSKGKYPFIEYYQPSKAIDVSDTPDAPKQRAAMRKIFEFPQESKEYHQHHPQLKGPTLPVTQQPTRDSSWEPIYISSRGRTIGTVSEAPQSPSLTPEPPPFSPPAEDQPDLIGSLDVVDQSIRYTGHDPAVQFSLYYDIQRRVLSVRVLGAYNLPSRTDFFMSVFMMPDRDKIFQTRICAGTPNPVFNQTFDFLSITSEDLLEQVVVFQVFSHDKFTRDNVVGSVIEQLSKTDLLGMNMIKKLGEGRELLQKFATGDLLLSLCYNPHSQVLQGIVLKASNLPRPHKWGLADPYVKVYLLNDQKRIRKWKSMTKKSTLAPVFNETFEFDLTGMDPKDINMEVFVMDHDRFRRNDVLGMVHIGASVPNELGMAHFSKVLAHPRHPISHWHKLIPHHQVKTRKRHKSNTM